MENSVSFVIPSYNSAATIKHTVESILGQKRSGNIKDIIIVDSSDDIKTRQILKELTNEKITTLLLGEKTFPAKARNRGVEYSKGDVLMFIDSDVYLSDDWLDKMLNAYQGGHRIASGSISLPESQKDKAIAKAQLYLQFNEYLDTGKMHSRRLIPSCNMMCDRKVFAKAGGFPELRASEDTSFCLKVANFEKIWFLAEAKSWHIFRLDRKSFFKNQELLGKFVLIYRKIYSNSWAYKGIIPIILFPGFLAVKLFRIFFRILKSGKRHIKQFFSSLFEFLGGLAFWSLGFIKGCFENENSERSIR